MVKFNDAALGAVFAALADPTRRRLLEQLGRGESTVSELAGPQDMSLPAVSKHLRVLESAGLLSRRRQGRAHRLRLEAAPMKRAMNWLEHYRRFWEGNVDSIL